MKELKTLQRMIEERRPIDRPMILAVDMDGTLCENRYPEMGEPNELLLELLKKELKRGSQVILWTCRAGEPLQKAKQWAIQEMIYPISSLQLSDPCLFRFFTNENTFDAIEKFGGDTRKIYADIYIDDRSMDHDVIWGEEVTEEDPWWKKLFATGSFDTEPCCGGIMIASSEENPPKDELNEELRKKVDAWLHLLPDVKQKQVLLLGSYEKGRETFLLQEILKMRGAKVRVKLTDLEKEETCWDDDLILIVDRSIKIPDYMKCISFPIPVKYAGED